MRFDFENIAGDLPAGHWFWDPARSGGIPVEHGVHFFDIACSLLGTGQVTCACSANRESGATDRWQIGVRYGANVLSSFYHAFVAPSALERTWCVLACERGILRLDGWIPTHLMVDALTDAAQADRLCALVPDLIATPLDAPHEVLANGRAFTVTHKVAGVWSPAPKQEIYAAAVRDAMSDFLAWVRDPAHPVRVTGEDGRDALAMAAAAVSRAQ
jgi:predicted dehydrogenase